MLLEFKCSNYKSFKEEMCFSMKPHSLQKGLDYSIQKAKIGNKTYKSLCSAVIYGPNAAGKTNIISAMDTFKNIVLRGHLNNTLNQSPNFASSSLELIPNYDNNKPVSFSIEFLSNNILVKYALTIDLGGFLENDYKRKVVNETLYINEKELYKRNYDSLSIEKNSFDYNLTVEKVFDDAILLAKANLKDSELFLTNGFKTIFSKELVEVITSWFNYNFQIIIRADSIETHPYIKDSEEEHFYHETFLDYALSEFGVPNSRVAYKTDKDGKSSLFSLIEVKNKNSFKAIPASFFESYGTIRFINEFPLIADALVNGGTLVIDEFDASIHPIALMSIITIFHNDEINKKQAQLIFNTHNPIFLDSSLFRRDEIKFVEFDSKNNTSTTYSLSDFKTAETSGTRKNSDYMSNYFVNRYGAITNVDFSPVFKSIMSNLPEDNNDGK